MEIDFGITKEYGKVIRNGALYKLGLTATNQSNSTVYRNEVDFTQLNQVRQSDKATEEGRVTTFINKGQLLSILCPIVYEYKLSEAIEEQIIAPFETVMIEHELDKTSKNIKLWKSYDTKGSEYDWYDKREKQRTDYRRSRYLRGLAGKDQAKFLYNLPSKVEVAKKLLSKITGKTIIFSVHTPLLYMITNNVVTNATKSAFSIQHLYFTTKKTKKGKKYSVKNVNTKEEKRITEKLYNEKWEYFKEKVYIDDTELINQFNNDEISLIASSKKIMRGINLKGVENAILLSYYSTNTELLQKLGRVLRYSEGKKARLFIIKTNETREVEWFQKMPKVRNIYNQVDHEIPLNITKVIKSYQL